jgi:hypothetical protein
MEQVVRLDRCTLSGREDIPGVGKNLDTVDMVDRLQATVVAEGQVVGRAVPMPLDRVEVTVMLVDHVLEAQPPGPIAVEHQHKRHVRADIFHGHDLPQIVGEFIEKMLVSVRFLGASLFGQSPQSPPRDVDDGHSLKLRRQGHAGVVLGRVGDRDKTSFLSLFPAHDRQIAAQLLLRGQPGASLGLDDDENLLPNLDLDVGSPFFFLCNGLQPDDSFLVRLQVAPDDDLQEGCGKVR